MDTIKKIGTTIGTFTLLSSKVLFLGGSLNTLNLPGSKLKQNFKGCMKKVSMSFNYLNLVVELLIKHYFNKNSNEVCLLMGQ